MPGEGIKRTWWCLWRTVVWVCAHLGFIVHAQCWVSLIAGVGYRVEQWGGKWDGTMGVANSCNWRGWLATMCQGSCLIAEAMSKSSVATFSSIMVRWSELGVTGD